MVNLPSSVVHSHKFQPIVIKEGLDGGENTIDKSDIGIKKHR